jgi:hypothetical protein
MPDTLYKSPRLPHTRDIYEVPDTPSSISTKRGLPDPYDVLETTLKPCKKYSQKTLLRLRPADTRHNPSTEEVAGQAAAEDKGTIRAGPGPGFKDEHKTDPSVQRCAVIIDQFVSVCALFQLQATNSNSIRTPIRSKFQTRRSKLDLTRYIIVRRP